MSTHCGTTDTDQDVVYVNQLRGDSFRLLVELADPNRNPVDVTGWGWRCQLRDTTDTVVADIVVDPTDAPIGVLHLTMTGQVTAGLPLGDYAFDLEGTDLTETMKTFVTGRVRVREDVTR
jgi:hypothetical protein